MRKSVQIKSEPLVKTARQEAECEREHGSDAKGHGIEQDEVFTLFSVVEVDDADKDGRERDDGCKEDHRRHGEITKDVSNPC